MKRIVIMMTLLAMVLGAGMASAADLMATGSWRIQAQWTDNLDMQENGELDGDSEDDGGVYQRIRTAFHFVANENLKAVLQIEVGTSKWGNNDWQLQGDQTNIEVKHAYIQFVWPNTSVTFLAGLMPVALPGGAAGNPIFDHDVAALVMSAPLTDSISLLAGWMRLYDLDSANTFIENDNGVRTQDNLDALFLALPMDFDGIALTPYMAYAYSGDDFLTDLAGNGANGNNILAGNVAGAVPGLLAQNGTIEDATEWNDADVDIWYGGLVFNMSLFDPINVAASFHYGSMDAPESHMDRAGWLFDLSVEYTGFDFVTPELFFAYSTGEDGNGTGDDASGEEDGSERLPVIRSAYGPTSVWFTGFYTGDGNETYDSDNKFGFWTVGLFLKNISFLENLTHQFNILYIAGTNDAEVGTAKSQYRPASNGVAYTQTLTEDDSIWEFDLLTDYAIYDELTLRLVLGYLSVDMDDENWAELAGDASEEDVMVMQLGLRYDF